MLLAAVAAAVAVGGRLLVVVALEWAVAAAVGKVKGRGQNIVGWVQSESRTHRDLEQAVDVEKSKVAVIVAEQCSEVLRIVAVALVEVETERAWRTGCWQ